MNKTKEESSLVATQRAGQELHADFCRWHARLIDAELVASCTLKNCPLQHAQSVHGCVKNPAHIVLRPGVTLADLRQVFGKDDWSLFKDCLPELRSALNKLTDSRHPAVALPEKGAVSYQGLLPHEGEPVGPLVGLLKYLVRNLTSWIGFSEKETAESLHWLLTDVAPASIEQGQLLHEFMDCHFQGFSLFAEERTPNFAHMTNIPTLNEILIEKKKPITLDPTLMTFDQMSSTLDQMSSPFDQMFSPFGLSTKHVSGLQLLDLSLIYLNHLAQLVCDEPLRLDLPQCRLRQKRFLDRNVLSSTNWVEDALAITDSTAASIMYTTFIDTLSPLGLTDDDKSLEQIDSMLSAMPSVDPIEAFVKMQRLLMYQIVQRLDDPDYPLSEGFDRAQLLVRYKNALARREKALKNWCACRDGAAAGSHRAHT